MSINEVLNVLLYEEMNVTNKIGENGYEIDGKHQIFVLDTHVKVTLEVPTKDGYYPKTKRLKIRSKDSALVMLRRVQLFFAENLS